LEILFFALKIVGENSTKIKMFLLERGNYLPSFLDYKNNLRDEKLLLKCSLKYYCLFD